MEIRLDFKEGTFDECMHIFEKEINGIESSKYFKGYVKVDAKLVFALLKKLDEKYDEITTNIEKVFLKWYH